LIRHYKYYSLLKRSNPSYSELAKMLDIIPLSLLQLVYEVRVCESVLLGSLKLIIESSIGPSELF